MDEFMEDLKTICLGYADLCFNISELRQLQARVAASTPDTAAVQEKLDEAEQLILNAVDMLGLITPKQDHPTLVIGYAETASIGALRVQLLNESPREDLFDYIDMAKTVMTTRRLNDSTVQGKYLVKAEALCEAARAGRK